VASQDLPLRLEAVFCNIRHRLNPGFSRFSDLSFVVHRLGQALPLYPKILIIDIVNRTIAS
jgi:hypothetical protein